MLRFFTVPRLALNPNLVLEMGSIKKERLTATQRLALNRRKADEEILLFSAVTCRPRNNNAKLRRPRRNFLFFLLSQ
jgi:hypothetical protein